MLRFSALSGLTNRAIIAGRLGGLVNGLGNWAVFACLEKGAKSSVAIPLTALYPLFTVLLATVFLVERPTALQWFDIAVAVTAGAMLSYEPSPEAQNPDTQDTQGQSA